MGDEKDRLGDKLRDMEAGREAEWAHKRDQEILAKLKSKLSADSKCPTCNQQLRERPDSSVRMLACPNGHGAWLDAETMKQLLQKK